MPSLTCCWRFSIPLLAKSNTRLPQSTTDVIAHSLRLHEQRGTNLPLITGGRTQAVPKSNWPFPFLLGTYRTIQHSREVLFKKGHNHHGGAWEWVSLGHASFLVPLPPFMTQSKCHSSQTWVRQAVTVPLTRFSKQIQVEKGCVVLFYGVSRLRVCRVKVQPKIFGFNYVRPGLLPIPCSSPRQAWGFGLHRENEAQLMLPILPPSVCLFLGFCFCFSVSRSLSRKGLIG